MLRQWIGRIGELIPKYRISIANLWKYDVSIRRLRTKSKRYQIEPCCDTLRAFSATYAHIYHHEIWSMFPYLNMIESQLATERRRVL